MLESTEIRWFFKGSVPSNISKILAETSPDVYESRTDYYLFVQGCDNIGIKIRNSRLEIKWRRDVQPYDVDKLNISGNIERWKRWEWTNKTASTEIEQLTNGGDVNPWIKVDKNRIQKKFDLRDDILVAVPLGELHSDFAMEVTELKSNGKSWWTIGFDSFTVQDRSFFDQIIETCLILPAGVDLKKEWSFGYPHWLSHVVN
ncbi:hypothetical protein [Candidatus Nitrosocosmicus arcticus]|uniref:CYTH domain-containing protein n=1 Tax=Candidatus Nitrosocosmicus arcticus TaxID=2035267 RepID=A0A557SSY2_9ARCH|nr:hypothetical protein [Candidatus Nitrosocosmicus arcticus]TVP39717.1 hypothetical protein NARC_130056 [Candidatus Nitrosocosmicus arcticus]